MSLGTDAENITSAACPNTGNVVRDAVCGLADVGIIVVVAAGNSASDFAKYMPAAFPEVLTVTAMADNDGKLGGWISPWHLDQWLCC